MSILRIALAQLNLTVGDLDGNAHRIEEAIRRARAWLADLVLMPELAVTGYPPEDLLLKPQFVQANRRVVERLAASTRGLAALVGCVHRGANGELYNAAAVLNDGRWIATYRKQCLPNTGVFDEKRYFTPGPEPLLLDVGGARVGLTICMDLWEEGPCRTLAAAGARLIMNLSASPYHAGKLALRERLFSRTALRHRVAIAYCNLVGGQDELVFDGASLVFDARGSLLARAAQFQEDFVVVDVPVPVGRGRASTRLTLTDTGAVPRTTCSACPSPTPLSRGARLEHRHRRSLALASQHRQVRTVGFLPAPTRLGVAKPRGQMTVPARAPLARRRFLSRLSPEAEVYEALTTGLRDYVRKNGFATVVLGLSGGVDSALTACIAADALGPTHVVGIIMPSRFSSSKTQADAARLAEALGIDTREISIEPVFQAYLDTLKPCLGDRVAGVTGQNIQARIRGNFLMALSNASGWLVVTTGNKSEMATGYTTLYGDMAGGLALIKDVPKTLVYRLARFRNARVCLTSPARAGEPAHGGHGPGAPIPASILRRAPTAELAPRQRDQDTLPPYDTLDRILEAYVEEDRSLSEILGRLPVRVPRAGGPDGAPQRGAAHASHCLDPATVKRVLWMVDRSEYKRRQGPPGIKITPRAFGRDRRMPITNRYRQY